MTNKTVKYKTKPVDYTGCNPIIAENSKKGLYTLCETNCENQYVIWDGCDYINIAGTFNKATPIPQTPYVKQRTALMWTLLDEGFMPETITDKKVVEAVIESNSELLEVDWKGGGVSFVSKMWESCGKKPDPIFSYKESWLEELP
jgi:hypothetical protein